MRIAHGRWKQINDMKKKELRLRCWITVDGEKYFGPGPAELLELIQETGSISKAALRMGMSYKKAWDIVDELNKHGSKPAVISRKGGEKGGGAVLTPRGIAILTSYRHLIRKLNNVIERDKSILKLI
jgi:molybdate transport system regulatory protein